MNEKTGLEDGGEDYTRQRQDWLPEDPEALKDRLLERESIGYLRERQRKKVSLRTTAHVTRIARTRKRPSERLILQ
ncbi:hypothetical protein FTO68_11065 [Methanocalculus taiwanensis]|uniref:Uncharacterized protein n=1 Tax=Methanocalculus taiwanensis TaxID=106207 RepID=A0ABD4TKT0_9EURY|nr:hypothetical protein [Methanocalculus taiwanensis]MCQ1539517.1 hypothetical protein [Methanocalculus taiwanensis]